VGINRGRKAPYFTRHFEVFLHSFHGLALVPWFHSLSFITYRIRPCQCPCVVYESAVYMCTLVLSCDSAYCLSGKTTCSTHTRRPVVSDSMTRSVLGVLHFATKYHKLLVTWFSIVSPKSVSVLASRQK
jgi:hypothetical protein